MLLSYWEVILRLGLAVVFGGAIGFERESQNLPAGFRTHILVCVGAALIMMVSAYGFTGPLAETVDRSRIAASVVTGIGFLGAGTILRQRGSIRGLTTAASIWVVSAIGLAVGIGFYFPAVLTTLVVLVSLLVLGRLDRLLISSYRVKRLTVSIPDRPGLMREITAIFTELKINIRKIEFDQVPASRLDSEDEPLEIEFTLVVPLNFDQNQLFLRLAILEEVNRVCWQGEVVPVNLYFGPTVSA
ncbi:MAG TPA: MgtC/SapB family protein [Bacillota bacterium]|nr:MgtC/SapB family protein [Bacillota bacterium]HOB29318.1 MgtC/SapB family protein [Bacillota bacterium]HPZ41903.1 MgtC/SapB family protein [Bacillota bacterium]HQD52834.1 MgtC/SapB family protein [Bacillota bacterium]